MAGAGLFVALPRRAWADRAAGTGVVLNQTTIDRLRGLGDPTSEIDVQEVFHPLAELISQRVRLADQARRDTCAFLGLDYTPTPFLVGITGSVAVGKSTVARLVAELLRRSPTHPDVSLVTTDSFLFDNETLRARGLLDAKGFPETYDDDALLRFVADIKAGRPASTPVYSHVVYDILPGQTVAIGRPDILVVEGVNVLQPPAWRGSGRPAVGACDFIDFAVYVDADENHIRHWFVQRFLQLRSTAFQDPSSFFKQFAVLDDDAAAKLAFDFWDEINGPNLRQCIEPTKQRADAILRKDADHNVDWVGIKRV